jgi:RNA polymerase sigma-70 factor (ECF subfamily)
VNELDDAALVRAAQAGDVTGLGVLLERHRARLHAVALGLLGHGPDAEDAVHDTFVIALRRIGELRDPAAVRGWLVAIVVNVCRGQLRRPALELPAAEAHDAVQRSIERTALRDWVWTALERLPEPMRVAVMLRYFSGASAYAAIADLCGVPVGTVRSRLNAAKARLADELLATAAAVHADTRALERTAAGVGAAMIGFEQSGDPALLGDVFTPDVRFRLFDHVERSGRDDLGTRLGRDFADGVKSELVRVTPGAEVAVVELVLHNPAEEPCTARPR